MAGQWISDESPEISINGNEAQCTASSPTGNVFNALWDDGQGGASDGQHYWKINMPALESEQMSIFVGLTDKDKFKKGWAIKGLLYGGNLSNGSALLVGDFGPRLKAGDEVGIFLAFENENLKVYFDVNGISLGLAFDLPKNIFKALYPVVHFSGVGSVKISKVAGAPSSLTRQPPVHVGIEGDWKLSEFKINGGVQPLPTTPTMRLTRTEPDIQDSFSVGIHIVNRLGFALKREGGSTWVTTSGMSTMMMGPPDFMTLEGHMNVLKTNPSKIELEGEEQVLVWNNTVSGMESVWKRYTITHDPVTKDPFH